jgi:hypothetical protein
LFIPKSILFADLKDSSELWVAAFLSFMPERVLMQRDKSN